jgi:uncharacterized DUF497 family protein
VPSGLRFEWDSRKSRANQLRHKVTFAEAATAFYDEHAILIDDPDHSEREQRFILLGFSSALRLLVVCHCYRQSEEVIRIISARRADRYEQQDYFGRFNP